MDPSADYVETLRAAVAGYDGPRWPVIRHVPDLYCFYVRLYHDARLPQPLRKTVSSVLAYFVIRDDVLSVAEHGAFGLIDDAYVAAVGYRELRRDVAGEVLYDAWEAEADLEDVMAEVYKESRAELGKKTRSILDLSGLRR